MSISSNIRKILSIVLFTLLGAGAIVLLVAAVRVRNSRVCTGIDIDINGRPNANWFIDKTDILKVLTVNNSLPLKNTPVKSVDLARIESRLRNEVWIRDAELYFDNKGVLKVRVDEREPIARVFSSAGTSFYVDSTGHRLPLSDKMSAKLPVFTGFPGDGKKLKAKDRKLIADIRDMSLYLLKDSFWMAQVAQIDITPMRQFEMVPTIGNHLIEFGNGSDYENKFKRLMIFYKNVLAKTGMDKYERIKVQYEGQVIGVRKQSSTPETHTR